jgi:hypothetical protein
MGGGGPTMCGSEVALEERLRVAIDSDRLNWSRRWRGYMTSATVAVVCSDRARPAGDP